MRARSSLRRFISCSPILAATMLLARAAKAEGAPAPKDGGAAPDADAASAPAEPSTNLGSPRAYLDYSDGTFFFRSADDNLVINTGGRVHLDTYAFAGPNVRNYHRSNGSELAPTMLFRRFVIESGGLVRKHWFFWIGGNFAPTQIDQNQAPTSTAAVYDGFVGYQVEPHIQIYAGQYNTPITMENVTCSRWLDFMERALVVRTVAAPYNKDLGLTVWTASKAGVAPLEVQAGVFGGDGMNRPNVDTRFDGMGRVVVRPFTSAEGSLERTHVGVSGRYGSRDDAAVAYDAPVLSTPGGYAFWSPTYTLADKTEVHILPSGEQTAIAGELYLPFERFDVKSEIVYAHEERREAASTARAVTLRKGAMEGWGGYMQLSYWPLGDVRVNGHPAGRYYGVRPPKDRGPEFPYGLQLLARGETLHLKYDGNSRTPAAPEAGISARTNQIRVSALQLAANYWATKHIRLTAEYSLYAFPGAPPSSGANVSNQAAAPGAKGTPADPSANILHEISFRVGLAL